MHKKRNTNYSILFPFVAMGVLILDTQTAMLGAQAGIDLCIRTVIPSLFPFFVLSVLVTSNLSGENRKLLSHFSRLFKIPAGAEPILLTGFLGGYPVGAQSIAYSVANGSLDKQNAHRMLGFCSNPGPAFLFGMAGNLFDESHIPWILWAILVFSAWMTSFVLPSYNGKACTSISKQSTTLSTVLLQSLRSMGQVCGWVILFRVVITFFSRWFLWLIPEEITILICGLLELTNGICALSRLADPALRFIFCSVLLSFGGICVAMQTASVCSKMGMGLYFPGKIIQSCFSLAISVMVSPILFETAKPIGPVLILFLFFMFGILFYKIHSRKSEPVVV